MDIGLLPWLIAKRKSLESPRKYWDSWWQELADYVSPRKAEITDKQGFPDDSKETILYDSTAVQANMTLAQGQLSLITPMEEQWFQLDAPKEVKHIPEVRRWYSECTEIMKLELSNSNFYGEIMEAYLDRGGFGTCNISLQESFDTRSSLNFRAHNIGTYSIEENASGYIDTVFASRRMSANQIKEEYGGDTDPNQFPEKVREALRNPKKMHEVMFTVYHAVFPRGQAPGENAPSNLITPFSWDKRFSSYHWMEENSQGTMLREGGFDQNPFFVSRYLKWGDDPYGWCPGWVALPNARQLNFLQRMLDTELEAQVFPRLLIPENMVDEIDLGPGGVTVFNAFNNTAKPETWGNNAQGYKLGMDRVLYREQRIQEAYHVDLFKMFSMLDRPGNMTAREVAERSAEKIIQFSPTFARITTEILTPLLRRTFQILHAKGKFPPPPMSALSQDQQGLFIPVPQVIYVSKLALAIKTMQNTSFMSLLEAIDPLVAVDPSTLRFLNKQRVVQGLSRNFGVPQEWLSTEQELREEEAAMAEQAQQQDGMMAAEAAGKVPPEMIDKLAGQLQAAS